MEDIVKAKDRYNSVVEGIVLEVIYECVQSRDKKKSVHMELLSGGSWSLLKNDPYIFSVNCSPHVACGSTLILMTLIEVNIDIIGDFGFCN